MKKIKELLAPIFYLAIIIIIISFIFITASQKAKAIPNNSITSNNVDASSNSTNINNDDEYRSNFNGENAVIYLGTHSQYEPFTVILDKSLPKEELGKEIISKISTAISYNIEINYIKFEDKNIYIDFSNDAAPFNIEGNYIESEKKLYSIYGYDNLVYTIFDSIYKSFTSYFGTDYNIYFSVNSENILIQDNNFTFFINTESPYILEK